MAENQDVAPFSGSDLAIVVAMANNQAIGRNNQLPWRLSTDLLRFKRLTMGHCLIMGRKTYDSIGRPLPGRDTIVLSRRPDLSIPGVQTANNWTDAVKAIPKGKVGFVVGGSEIYQQALPLVKRLFITRVLADVEGDAFFPDWECDSWRCDYQEFTPAGPKDDWPTRFEQWIR